MYKEALAAIPQDPCDHNCDASNEFTITELKDEGGVGCPFVQTFGLPGGVEDYGFVGRSHVVCCTEDSVDLILQTACFQK